MDIKIVRTKLGALEHSVAELLANVPSDRPYRFSVKHNRDLFDRYAPLRDYLRESEPDYFSDLPVREFEVVDGDQILNTDFVLLLRDIRTCMRTLRGREELVVPAARVTREGVFFAGEYFDAFRWVAEIVDSALESLAVIDGYVDVRVLDILSGRKPGVTTRLLTKQVKNANQFEEAVRRFREQYGDLQVRTSDAFHDRFIIVDLKEYYHLGASVKDLGRRGFMFSRIEEPSVLEALQSRWRVEWERADVLVR